MALISTSIPNLINGVSQQPYTLRLASQAQEQINALSSVSEGLRKRPPTKHVSRFSRTPTPAAFSHIINRDLNERYVVLVKDGQLKVYDLDGNEKVVKTPDGVGYLQCANPETDLEAVTVADYTFILNKTITVAEDDNSKTGIGKPYQSLLWVKQGAYSTTYKVQVDGVDGTYVTPYSGDTGANQAVAQAAIQTINIASQLIQALAPGLGPKGFNLTQIGSTILVSHPTRDYDISVFDALGDTSLKLVKGQVQTFSDLPARGAPNFKLKIVGTQDNAFDGYWVQFTNEPSNPNGGVWKECAADGENTSYLGSTMPHLLVREADGTFSFEEAAFDPRLAGDHKSAPMPSFVGNKINGIVFHRNRLAFLADENIVFSQAGEFFNFFRKTAIQILDTDPVDVAVTTTKVSILKHAVPFNETLMLFSDQTQFQLAKNDILTPKTIGINPTTEFSCNTLARPVAAGANVYFAQTRGGYSGLREYYVDPVTAINDATDVTSHCPTYIPGTIRKMAATTNENTIVCLSDTQRDTLYVYRYYWSQQTKLQSSWSKWVLPSGTSILDCEFLNSTLVLVLSRPDGCHIEKMELQSGTVDLDASYQVYLDRRIDETLASPVYQAAGQVTKVVLPYDPQPGEQYSVIAWEDTVQYKKGQLLTVTPTQDPNNGNAWSLIIPGSLNRFIAGVKYPFSYTFSPFIMREQAPGGQGMQAVTEGRLQIRHCRVAYSQTGYFEARVSPNNGNTYRYPFTGRILANVTATLGKVGLDTSQFQFPVSSRNDQVSITLFNDSHLPCAFLSAEWEGFYTIRSRRM